jgi:hypothetical protein
MNTLKSLAATGLLCGGMVLGVGTASVLDIDQKNSENPHPRIRDR